ncbi:MAG: lysophospholipid acyltransferase family protein [Candidatus Caldatribacteriaceae bacterium]
MANHLSVLDPFLVDALSPYPIVWVANRLIFQHPFLGPLIRAMDAIPKTKAIPDCSAVLRMPRVLEDRGVVGFFPEGSVPWNGVNQEFAPGTEKLLAKLRVPVVFAHIRGAWMRKPLWADHSRTGSVFIRFTVLSNSSLVPFQHSEWKWQKEEWVVFRDDRSAEGIERVVFFCPHCESFRSVIGKNQSVLCRFCGHRWTVDECGFIGGKPRKSSAKTRKSFWLPMFLG